MRRMFGLGVLLAVTVGFVAVVRAAPLDLKQVSDDAKWAAHMDFDALHASSMCQKAREEMLKKHPEAEAKMAMVRSILKFDPATDLHGVTIYGTQMKKDTGVAIVSAKVDQNMLLEKAKLAPEHRVSTYGKYELHSWVHAKGSKHQRSMAGTFYKPDVMVFGASAEEVMAALDVLDGTKPNFAGKEPAMCSAIPAGAVLVAGVTGLADAHLPCKSPLAKQIDSVAMAIGETGGEVFVGGKVVAKQAETAQQLKTVIEGGLALAALAHSDDADALKMVKAIKVTVSDNSVNVESRVPADEVWACVQKAIAKAKAGGKMPWDKDWRRHGPPGGPPRK